MCGVVAALLVTAAACAPGVDEPSDVSESGGGAGGGGNGGGGAGAGASGPAGAASTPDASPDEVAWPSAASAANSDPWIAENHARITVMRPRILVLNFVEGKTVADATAKATEVADAYRVATRHHGTTDPSAPSFIDMQIAKVVDLTDHPKPAGWTLENGTRYPRTTLPNGSPGMIDYARFFDDTYAKDYGFPDGAGGNLKLCDLVDRGLVHEVWVYAAGDPKDSGAYESVESKQRYDAQRHAIAGSFDLAAGNGVFPAGTPVCARSIRIAFINYSRGIGCFLESLGHSFERMALGGSIPYLVPYFRELGGFDLDTRYGLPFDSWYACGYDGNPPCVSFGARSNAGISVLWNAQGRSGTIPSYLPACGNAHFPPNGRGQYDIVNPGAVPSTCAHFRMHDGPTGADAVEDYSAAKVASFQTLAPDCTGAWEVYWRQNFPGLRNHATDDQGQPMLNWWPFLYY